MSKELILTNQAMAIAFRKALAEAKDETSVDLRQAAKEKPKLSHYGVPAKLQKPAVTRTEEEEVAFKVTTTPITDYPSKKETK